MKEKNREDKKTSCQNKKRYFFFALFVIASIIIAIWQYTENDFNRYCIKDKEKTIWRCEADSHIIFEGVKKSCKKKGGVVNTRSQWQFDCVFISDRDKLCNDDDNCMTNYCVPNNKECEDNCSGKCSDSFRMEKCGYPKEVFGYGVENGKVIKHYTKICTW